MSFIVIHDSFIRQGVNTAWTAMMVINLTKVCCGSDCLTQHWVNYLGIYASVASTVAAVAIARAADIFRGCLKTAILLLLTTAAVVFTFLSLISVGSIHFSNLDR